MQTDFVIGDSENNCGPPESRYMRGRGRYLPLCRGWRVAFPSIRWKPNYLLVALRKTLRQLRLASFARLAGGRPSKTDLLNFFLYTTLGSPEKGNKEDGGEPGYKSLTLSCSLPVSDLPDGSC